jgi:serine phosphatase RsbU (regulator of sigma subunit)
MVVTDGPVDPKSRLFVGRSEELRILNSWLATTACVGAVMGARQTGKTSLLLKLRHALRRKYAFAFIDMQTVEGADIGECFAYLAAEITTQLNPDRPLDGTLPGTSQEFLTFLRNLSADTRAVRHILILDELGALPPATAMKLASTIRALFTNRLVKTEYAKYVVLLAGATDMLELTTGRNSPLRNVTESIYLSDLSVTETQQLLTTILGRSRVQSSPSVIRQLHDWTGGHPYWTQLLAGALRRPSGVFTEDRLASIIEGLLPNEDKNLPHVFKLLKDDQGLWGVIDLLLNGSALAFSRANPAVARLELIGLVKNSDGHCAIRNRIYREVLLRQQSTPGHLGSRDLRRLTQSFSQALQRDELFRLAVEQLRPLLHSRSVALFARGAGSTGYHLAASDGLPPTAAAAAFRANSRLASHLDSAFDLAAAELDDDETRTLRELNGAAIVPLPSNGEPLGFLVLGRQLSNRNYDQHDLDFVSAVAEQVVAHVERLRLREIELDAERARRMQEELLPKTIPQMRRVQIAAHWKPARSVGGDYYDVLSLGDDKVGVCVGDVVGKGMAAALMMSNLQAAVRTRVADSMAPNELCRQLNQLIAGNVSPGKYITFFYALIDGGSHSLTYTNAGHNPPIVLKADDRVQRLSVGGAVLGVFPDGLYESDTIEMHPGDRILLFTDGASEIWNSHGSELGEEGLIELFRKSRAEPNSATEDVMAGLISFCGGNFADDVTLVVVAQAPISRGP